MNQVSPLGPLAVVLLAGIVAPVGLLPGAAAAATPRGALSVIQAEGAGVGPIPDAGEADLHELVPGLFLIQSARTRSQLYHALKRRFAPDRLLVAPLAAAPKFKGMASGALAWLRARDHR